MQSLWGRNQPQWSEAYQGELNASRSLRWPWPQQESITTNSMPTLAGSVSMLWLHWKNLWSSLQLPHTLGHCWVITHIYSGRIIKTRDQKCWLRDFWSIFSLSTWCSNTSQKEIDTSVSWDMLSIREGSTGLPVPAEVVPMSDSLQETYIAPKPQPRVVQASLKGQDFTQYVTSLASEKKWLCKA